MSIHKNIPIVSIVGDKNSGKTSLIEQLVSALKKEGYRVGVMKYALREFQMDREGKDTYRFYQSGADAVGIASSDQMALIKRIESPPPVDSVVESYFSDADIVLLEGHRGCDCPRISLVLSDKEPRDVGPAQGDKGRTVLRLVVSGQNNPVSHESLQKALDFVRRVIKGSL